MFKYGLKFITLFSLKSNHLVRFCQLQIYASLIMVLDYQEANMMQQHGLRLVSHRSMRDYLVMKSGFGQTLHIPCKNGVRHLIRSILSILTVICHLWVGCSVRAGRWERKGEESLVFLLLAETLYCGEDIGSKWLCNTFGY
jgi:hypothetical protein